MGNVNVHVYKNSDGEFQVYPPVVVVSLGNNDTVTLVNHADEDLGWLAPKGLFTTTVSHHDEVGKGGGKKAKAVKKEGAYNHMVLMESGKKAKGNSDPVIIVEA